MIEAVAFVVLFAGGLGALCAVWSMYGKGRI